jgi:hypothetical protein
VDTLCGVGGSCSYDFYSLGSRLNWYPVKALTIGLEIMYHEFGTQTGAAALTAAGVGALRDNDVWASMMRVQVDF